jgi:hypothetical protein
MANSCNLVRVMLPYFLRLQSGTRFPNCTIGWPDIHNIFCPGSLSGTICLPSAITWIGWQIALSGMGGI